MERPHDVSIQASAEASTTTTSHWTKVLAPKFEAIVKTYKTASNETSSNKTSLYKTVPNETASNKTASNETSSDQNVVAQHFVDKLKIRVDEVEDVLSSMISKLSARFRHFANLQR